MENYNPEILATDNNRDPGIEFFNGMTTAIPLPLKSKNTLEKIRTDAGFIIGTFFIHQNGRNSLAENTNL